MSDPGMELTYSEQVQLAYLRGLTDDELLCRKTRRHDYDPDGYRRVIRWPKGLFAGSLCRWLVCRRCETERVDLLRQTEDGLATWYQHYSWPDHYRFDTSDFDHDGNVSAAIEPWLAEVELLRRSKELKRIPAGLMATIKREGWEDWL